jgi:hypothetical protein
MQRQTNQIAPPEFVFVVGLKAFVQQLDYFFGHLSSPNADTTASCSKLIEG